MLSPSRQINDWRQVLVTAFMAGDEDAYRRASAELCKMVDADKRCRGFTQLGTIWTKVPEKFFHSLKKEKP